MHLSILVKIYNTRTKREGEQESSSLCGTPGALATFELISPRVKFCRAEIAEQKLCVEIKQCYKA